MGLIEFRYEEGQTPLDEDEKDGLLLPTVTTRGELDEVEQRNIEEAIRWTMERRKRFTVAEILTEGFARELHQKMLGSVWDWAGAFRKSDKNIGADKYLIPVELRALLDDCKFWIESKTFGEDEIAIRFKHRIVTIHCFANDNGRHSQGVTGGRQRKLRAAPEICKIIKCKNGLRAFYFQRQAATLRQGKHIARYGHRSRIRPGIVYGVIIQGKQGIAS